MKELKITKSTEIDEDEDETQPVSPMGQYFNSKSLSMSILAVLEFETAIEIDDNLGFSLIQDLLLPINPRFSSVMITTKTGEKHWKKVDVEIKDHFKVPIFSPGMSPQFYDTCFEDYMSNLSFEPFAKNKPLWEIHMFKYKTSDSAGNIIFKFHHALGDGYSLMGALLSCLQRADDPSLPLTFPFVKSTSKNMNRNGRHNVVTAMFKGVLYVFSLVFDTLSDIFLSFRMINSGEDDISSVRSGKAEFCPMRILTVGLSLNDVKQIKDRLGVTINDVITGIIFLATRMYMEETGQKTRTKSTALVLFNTRMLKDYKSVKDMVKEDSKSPWGNQFAMLHIPIPNLITNTDPLEFVRRAHHIIRNKRNSLLVYIAAWCLEVVRKIKGSEEAAKFVYKTLKHSSTGITNMVGPKEKMALANHPIKGFYFMVVGTTQSLVTTVVSYNDNLRIGIGTETDYIDNQKFKKCIERAFEIIFRASCGS